MSERRHIDERREVIMTDIVNRNVFDSRLEIVKTRDMQIKGVDAIYDGKYIDFKFQVGDRYVGNPTPTFAFELQTDNRMGNTMTGWFLDESKITDAYGLVWITKGEINPFLPHEIEYMQVDVNKLKRFVYSMIPKEKLPIILEDLYGTNNRYTLDDGCRIVSSGSFFERPINIVIPKRHLEKCATIHNFYKVV